MSKTFRKRFSGQRFAGCKAGRMANHRHTVAGSIAAPITPHGEPWRQMFATAQAGFCAFAVCASLGGYGRQWAKAQTVSAAQVDFRHGGVLRFAAHEKAADHSGSGLAIYINNPVGIITTVRALPLKKIFLNPPLGGFTQPEKPAFFRNRLKSVLCF